MGTQEYGLAAARFISSVGGGAASTVTISRFMLNYALRYASSANSPFAQEGRRLLIHALHIEAGEAHIDPLFVEKADRMISENAYWQFEPRRERVVDRIRSIAPSLLVH
jgi:hypothetical protein